MMRALPARFYLEHAGQPAKAACTTLQTKPMKTVKKPYLARMNETSLVQSFWEVYDLDQCSSSTSTENCSPQIPPGAAAIPLYPC